jgi:cytochrome c oxidase assembly protein subunit 15
MKRTPTDLIRMWYWSGAILVFIILVIGGITRLTQSGLSIVEWSPIMGVIPPLSEADWEAAFDQYRQFPEYQQLNKGMSMSEFKFIFFWEYLHRLVARIIGLVFLIPFIWFAWKKHFDKRQFKRATLLFGLGFAQGFMGWFMVMSGLNEDPFVSPYRLGMHLMLAFIIFGCCVWFALDLRKRSTFDTFIPDGFKKLLWGLLGLTMVQIFWGALVAGHKAGYIANTFPKMHGRWIPENAWILDPAIINIFQNPTTVQWMHRLLGTLVLITAIWLMVKAIKNNASPLVKQWTAVLLGVISIQYITGILTLVFHVPVSLGVLHQALAMILFGIFLGFLHLLKQQKTQAI